MALLISPRSAPIDSDIDVKFTELEPGSIVHLSLETARGHGHRWRSENYYLVDPSGGVSVRDDAPVWGDCTGPGVDTMLAHQLPPTGVNGGFYGNGVNGELVTTVVARQGGKVIESGEFRQFFMDSGVSRFEFSDEGGVGGVAFVPPGIGPFPTVALLNGSNGGINEYRAAAYASRGILTVAVPYFNYKGHKDYINDTELATIRCTLRYIHERFTPKEGKLVVSGASRGGELSLILGSMFPREIQGVAAYVPGAFVHSAQTAKVPHSSWRSPAWLMDGEPLFNLFQDNDHITSDPFLHETVRYEDHRRRHSPFIDAMSSVRHYEKARIPVERIRGPVLLVTGGDDKVWPGRLAARIVIEELRKSAHPYTVKHLDWADAGHSIDLPSIPRVIDGPHPISGVRSNSGGTRAANAKASRESYSATVNFILQDVYS